MSEGAAVPTAPAGASVEEAAGTAVVPSSSPPDGAADVATAGDPVLEGNGMRGNSGAVVIGSTHSVGDKVAVIAGTGVAVDHVDEEAGPVGATVSSTDEEDVADDDDNDDGDDGDDVPVFEGD